MIRKSEIRPIAGEPKTIRSPRVHPILGLALAVLAAACGTADEAGMEDSAVAENTVAVVRTANPDLRGYGPDEFPRIKEIAPDVYTYEQLRSAGDERFATVSLFVVTDDGVIVADGQGSVEETQRMIDAIAGVTEQPIRTVVVCSDHGDHTAGNSAFPEDADFIAHPTSAAALQATARAASSDSPPVRMATVLVDDELVIERGGKTVRVLFLGRAHTGGDLVVHLPEEKVLFMSEAYLHRVFPAMRAAYPSEWVRMIERAQEMDIETYVPGHGFVDAPEVLTEELETYRQAVSQVIAEASRFHSQGATVADAQAGATFGDLESWSLRSSQGNVAIARVYAELNGELPNPVR